MHALYPHNFYRPLLILFLFWIVVFSLIEVCPSRVEHKKRSEFPNGADPGTEIRRKQKVLSCIDCIEENNPELRGDIVLRKKVILRIFPKVTKAEFLKCFCTTNMIRSILLNTTKPCRIWSFLFWFYIYNINWHLLIA